MALSIIPKKWDDLDYDDQNRLLSRSEQDIEEAISTVKPIIEAVVSQGDTAVRRFTRQFDGVDLDNVPLALTEKELEETKEYLEPNVKDALQFAIENVRRFHSLQKREEQTLTEIRTGIFAGERTTPIDSVGLYVPRGRGSFPSMLYMLAVPAVLAGVPDIAVVTPPNSDGTVDAACLYAAHLCGIRTIYRVGGAQAVAALAYGTESIAKTVKIIGPGSMYVAAAKRLVAHITDTGLPAGPSESVIIADAEADPYKVALDLLIEAEHGSDSQAILLTSSEKLAENVAETAASLVEDLPEPRKGYVTDVLTGYGGIIVTKDLETAVTISNRIAPEHLQIQSADPFEILSLITNAGEILLGENTPFSAANYVIGANAVLPTGGGAKTYSAVSVRDFCKTSSVIYTTRKGYDTSAPHVQALADYEGFVTHGNAIRFRKGMPE